MSENELMPRIDATAWVASGATVVGDVTLGPESSVWYGAVIRADAGPIVVGARTNVQDNAVIHVSEGRPVMLGEGVTIGHAAIVHGCTVGDNSLIGMGAIVLDGAVIGRDCIVGAGALVPQGRVVEDGTVVLGSPIRVLRDMTEEDVRANQANAEEYVRLSRANMA